MSDTREPPASSPTAKRAAFEREALPHLDAVYRFALRLSGSPAAAEDLVQETFYRAFRAWDQYTPGTAAKSWLFTICRNVFLRNREREKRHDEILEETTARSPEQLSRENAVFVASQTDDPEGAFFASLVDDRILDAIDALQEEYRTAVVLSDVQGMSYAEIADIMGVPVGTVKSRLFRGRRQLQEKLYDYAVEMGYLGATSREAS
ncbi:MAG: sigma-70 family RNA polymerase sigma factor [Gemmatimonadota bacterium]|nr:sigma-70 family RNA polymerase sigma factor [Gemmatimonadota bacterium]